jgi:glycerol-3-phosphate dehydrogenase
MQLADGGADQIEKVREIAQPELGWSDIKWEMELTRYHAIYAAAYSPAPPQGSSTIKEQS